jgi:hypothetical protein
MFCITRLIGDPGAFGQGPPYGQGRVDGGQSPHLVHRRTVTPNSAHFEQFLNNLRL